MVERGGGASLQVLGGVLTPPGGPRNWAVCTGLGAASKALELLVLAAWWAAELLPSRAGAEGEARP